MNNRREELLAQIMSAEPLAETKETREALLILLKDPLMLSAMKMVLDVSDARLTYLGNTDLTTDSGVKKAIMLQADSRAFSSVVEQLVDFATTLTDEEIINDKRQQ